MTTVILTLATGGSDVTAEQLSARCWALGCSGIEERRDSIRAVFPDDQAADLAAAMLAEHVTGPPRSVDDPLAGWAAPPVTVAAGRFRVRSPGAASLDEDMSPAEGIGLTIEPGRAFGSGSHPSTRAALDLMGRRPMPATVLDVGTGTGVLAIAAARLGAHSVRAVDIDRAAVESAVVNAALNQVGAVIEVDATPTENLVGSFELALVNLTIDGHRAVAATVVERLAASAEVIASGVLAGDQESRLELCYADLEVTDRCRIDEWVALRLDRSP